jgi:hypothetical protein
VQGEKMDHPFINFLLFLLFIAFGIPLLIEGFSIMKLGKKLVPFPTKILYWIGVLIIGKEKSRLRMADRTTPGELRSYASFALVSGTTLMVFGLLYLLRALLQ